MDPVRNLPLSSAVQGYQDNFNGAQGIPEYQGYPGTRYLDTGILIEIPTQECIPGASEAKFWRETISTCLCVSLRIQSYNVPIWILIQLGSGMEGR